MREMAKRKEESPSPEISPQKGRFKIIAKPKSPESKEESSEEGKIPKKETNKNKMWEKYRVFGKILKKNISQGFMTQKSKKLEDFNYFQVFDKGLRKKLLEENSSNFSEFPKKDTVFGLKKEINLTKNETGSNRAVRIGLRAKSSKKGSPNIRNSMTAKARLGRTGIQSTKTVDLDLAKSLHLQKTTESNHTLNTYYFPQRKDIVSSTNDWSKTFLNQETGQETSPGTSKNQFADITQSRIVLKAMSSSNDLNGNPTEGLYQSQIIMHDEGKNRLINVVKSPTRVTSNRQFKVLVSRHSRERTLIKDQAPFNNISNFPSESLKKGLSHSNSLNILSGITHPSFCPKARPRTITPKKHPKKQCPKLKTQFSLYA